MLNGLDLFSGIGGIALALKDWVRPIAYCEIDLYCQGMLLSRMAGGLISTAPIWDEIRSFPIQDISSGVDIIFGGFPCQDISVAGLGKGLEGERSGLFFEIVRLSKKIKPKFIFLENVPAITSRGGLRVIREIAEMGYDCRWCAISAASVGALHRRERWFLLGHAKHTGSSGLEERRSPKAPVYTCEEGKDEASKLKGADSSRVLAKEPIPWRRTNVDDTQSGAMREDCQNLGTTPRQIDSFTSPGTFVADPESEQSGRIFESESQPHPFDVNTGGFEASWWATEPDVGRVANGIPQRVDRLRALGNAVVPCQAKEAFQILMGLK